MSVRPGSSDRLRRDRGLALLEPREARGDLLFAAGVLGLLLLQMTVGDIQWREHLPWPLVLVHVTLATAVWFGVVALTARLLLRSRPVLP
jgi:heme A synthase